MIIKSVNLETVCGITSTLPLHPETEYPEVAFAGKSNVGKSSLINALCNRKSYARTSSSPGKTQTINYYNINEAMYFVDLPGYGYAKVSRDAQNKWQKYLEEYLLKRENICSLVQLIDGRHEIQKNDYQMREWVLAYNLPIITVVTKMDYVPKTKIQNVLQKVEKEFGGLVLPFSATDNRYNEKVLDTLIKLGENSLSEKE